MPAGEATLEKAVRETTVEIKNADGLHLRPAMRFVDLASRFDCDVSVSNGQTTVDGKSIMHMSLLAATYGTHLNIRAVGPQAQEAVEALRHLVEVEMFGESPPAKT
jgi:phosphocarrier protein HPr